NVLQIHDQFLALIEDLLDDLKKHLLLTQIHLMLDLPRVFFVVTSSRFSSFLNRFINILSHYKKAQKYTSIITSRVIFSSLKKLKINLKRHNIISFFFFSSRRRHTRSVSAFLLNRSSDLQSHLSFCVLLQYLVERRRVVTQLGKLD